jgi:hypothetical protein
MSETSKAFLADPSSFMKRNILIVDDRGLWGGSKDMNFDLVSGGAGLSASGAKIPVYRLAKADAKTTDPIEAYWLAYQPEGIESKILTTARKVFFTQELSGCGFVAGSGASPIVKHIDGAVYRNDEIIDNPANAGMDIYTAANYEGASEDPRGNGRATVFGVKGTRGWEFWAQARWRTTKDEHKLRFAEGIMPI